MHYSRIKNNFKQVKGKEAKASFFVSLYFEL